MTAPLPAGWKRDGTGTQRIELGRHAPDTESPGRCYGDHYLGSRPWPCPDAAAVLDLYAPETT